MNFKFALSCAALAFASAAHANGWPLNDLASIKHSLDTGNQVSVVVDLSLCSPEGSTQASQTKGGLTIGSYRVIADSTLSFSDSHFTVASSSNKPIQQFLRYQVKADGSVAFSSTIFSLPDLALLSQASFRCAIGNGVNFIRSR